MSSSSRKNQSEFEGRVLIIDDDTPTLRQYRRVIEAEKLLVDTTQTVTEAEHALARTVYDVCLLDLDLGDSSGFELLPKLREWAPWMRVIMVTATNDVSVALKAVRSGASDYLLKPCSPDQLAYAVSRQLESRRVALRLEQLESDIGTSPPDLTTHSRAVSSAYALAHKVADVAATVLILGESGTGKTVLARAIHEWSPRRHRNFATISCPSLSPELLASELFGHVRGAFTGATENRQGRVQIAEGGTLFLDEIGDLPLSLQPKLLRFLQDQEYERVGDPHTRRADVRVIGATNRDLAAMVAQGEFREDLYYRINVINVRLPPLRERREDIVQIGQRIILELSSRYGRPARRFSDEAVTLLKQHDWPGNLRELHNAVERAVIVGEAEELRPEDLPFSRFSPPSGSVPNVGDPVRLDELERAHIEAVIGTAPSFEIAARLLGIDSSTLYRKRKQYQTG